MLKEKFNKTTDKPYDKVLRCTRQDLRISGDAFRLWMTLYYSAEDWNPTVASLAMQFKVCERTMKTWIKELKSFGYMTIHGNKENGYTWSINKKSKGVVNTNEQGAKFYTLKNKMNPSTKVQKNSNTKVQKITPIIKMNAAATSGAAFKQVKTEKVEENPFLISSEIPLNFFDND